MEVATRDEIKTGKATILCSLDNQKPKEYEIEIEEIYKENNYDNKSMLIKVTDEELLEKTGGIIQGMSGSPGAVTHVLVKNPTEGYRSIWRYNVKTSKRSRMRQEGRSENFRDGAFLSHFLFEIREIWLRILGTGLFCFIFFF